MVTPKVPSYTVSGVSNAGAAGSTLTLSKSDGSTFIAVWNAPQIWDPPANIAVTPPADPVTVSFGARFAYKVYDPLVGLVPIASSLGSKVSVNVVGSPIMIQIMPKKALEWG